MTHRIDSVDELPACTCLMALQTMKLDTLLPQTAFYPSGFLVKKNLTK
jgi:hypothetical protein